MDLPPSSRQPERQPWALEALIRERALAMSRSLDFSTRHTYASTLNSWLAFINMHNFDIQPTPDTLSYFVVNMSHQISPRSVKSYLSGLVQQLEPNFPNIREVRGSRLVTRTMKGCLKMLSKPIQRKDPLSIDDLQYLQTRFHYSQNHDDLLFFALLVTGFHGLLRLGELTFPDDPAIREWRKVPRRGSLILQSPQYTFLLAAHKADRFFEGNRVVIRAFEGARNSFDPFPVFSQYIASRDRLFPAASPLWLTSKGDVPTRSFFMSCFHTYFSKSYGGASMRAGGATHLAKLGTSSSVIHGLGRWSSEAWEVYIRIHPTLLQALLHRQHHH
jgi:hypothetical protein